jgi:hypothetical protein
MKNGLTPKVPAIDGLVRGTGQFQTDIDGCTVPEAADYHAMRAFVAVCVFM